MDFRYVKKEFIDPSLIEDIQNSLKLKITPYTGNADDLIETGFYSVTGSDLVARGFPLDLETSEALVKVFITESGFINQQFSFSNVDRNYTYFRGKTNTSNWGKWEQVITTFDISTSSKDLYIDPILGTDVITNGNSPGSGAFKTIAYAIFTLQKTNLKRVSLILAKGIYNEDISLSGFKIGKIYIVGNNRADTIVKSINIYDCDDVSINKLTANNFDIRSGFEVSINDCGKTTSSVFGLYCLNSKISVYNCEFSNTSNAGIACSNNSIIYLDQVIGTNNLVGIVCSGSVVRKNSNTTITGNTNQQVSNGGQIVT